MIHCVQSEHYVKHIDNSSLDSRFTVSLQIRGTLLGPRYPKILINDDLRYCMAHRRYSPLRDTHPGSEFVFKNLFSIGHQYWYRHVLKDVSGSSTTADEGEAYMTMGAHYEQIRSPIRNPVQQ